jgi:hypothetical protein
MEPPHTTLGHPHPRYTTTSTEALLVAPTPSDDEYPQTLPWPRPKEHVMALHPSRQDGVS